MRRAFLLILGLLAAPAGLHAGERLIEPYYNFEWYEGLIIPSVGDVFVGSNFGTSLGGRMEINKEHSAFAVYDLQYKGPGLQSQEGRLFSERVIDHNLFGEHHWNFMPRHTLKSRLLYMRELRRAAASEVFGNGLYDFYVLGGTVTEEYALNPKIALGLGITYRYFKFPNYTDLMQEFQSGAVGTEVSGSQQDYHNVRIEASSRFTNQGRAWLALSLQNYINAKVIESTGVTGTSSQRDSVVELGAAWLFQIPKFSPGWPGRYYSTPSLRLNFKRSNQNFLRFREFGDLNPDFVEDNYSYNYVDLSAPVNWTFQNGWRLFFTPRWLYYGYVSRPPRDTVGEYVGGEQFNHTVLLSLGASKRVKRFANWTFAYGFHSQQSNTRFEKYVPYNFTGHTLSSSLSISY